MFFVTLGLSTHNMLRFQLFEVIRLNVSLFIHSRSVILLRKDMI